MLTESASAGAVVMAVSSESIQTGQMDIFEMAAPSSKKQKAGGRLTALRPTSSPRAAVPLQLGADSENRCTSILFWMRPKNSPMSLVQVSGPGEDWGRESQLN